MNDLKGKLENLITEYKERSKEQGELIDDYPEDASHYGEEVREKEVLDGIIYDLKELLQ